MTTPDVVMHGLTCCKFGGMCNECQYNLDDEQNEIDIADCTKALAEDVYEYVEQLVTNTPRWISVKDRLPESDDTVLCWYEYYRFGDHNAMYQTYGIGHYFNGMWGGDVANGRKAKVLYWQPMPEPPKEG